MDKKMETTIVYWGSIGIMEKKMETTKVKHGETMVFDLAKWRLSIHLEALTLGLPNQVWVARPPRIQSHCMQFCFQYRRRYQVLTSDEIEPVCAQPVDVNGHDRTLRSQRKCAQWL